MHLEALPDRAREILRHCARQPLLQHFYLAGGSAVALHLGHRISVDLDFFTPQKSYEAEPLTQALGSIGKLTIQQQGQGTLVGSLAGVRVSFFVYPYPLLEKPEIFEGIQVAAILDLALMKLIAISQRGKKRDFVDLCAICRQGYRLGDLLRRVPEKYPGVTYPSYHLLRALVYFGDAETDESPQMLTPLEWTEVKRFFTGEIPGLLKSLGA